MQCFFVLCLSLNFFMSLLSSDSEKRSDVLISEVGPEARTSKEFQIEVSGSLFHTIQKNGYTGMQEVGENVNQACVFYSKKPEDDEELINRGLISYRALSKQLTIVEYIKQMKGENDRGDDVYVLINRHTPFYFVIRAIEKVKGISIGDYCQHSIYNFPGKFISCKLQDTDDAMTGGMDSDDLIGIYFEELNEWIKTAQR